MEGSQAVHDGFAGVRVQLRHDVGRRDEAIEAQFLQSFDELQRGGHIRRAVVYSGDQVAVQIGAEDGEV